MSALLLVTIALLTYVSRAAALVLLPPPPPRFAAMLERVPAPIFASLAMATLITGDGALLGGPTVAAAVGALVASPMRSLLLCLIGGGAGYTLGALLLG
jgi:branched-subunit amino acid transport protein